MREFQTSADSNWDKEPGVLVYHSYSDPTCLVPKFHISEADPQVWILNDLLWKAFWAPTLYGPFIKVTRPSSGHGSTGHGCGDEFDGKRCMTPPGGVCFTNAKVKFTAENGEWVYIVSEYCWEKDVWSAHWPD